MIEKPFALLSVFWGSDTGWQYDCSLEEEFDNEKYLASIGELSVPLYSKSQLKAERERAIRECAEACLSKACEAEILKLLDN